MRIGAIEERLRQGEFSEELLGEFRQALNRVPRQARCRHCRAAALGMPPENRENAIRLLRLGLEEYGDSWSDVLYCYRELGNLQEVAGGYAQAKEAYCRAVAAVPENLREEYAVIYSFDLLRLELHCGQFQYTQDLAHYEELTRKSGSFQQGLLKNQFYLTLARMILLERENRLEEAEKYYAEALEMCREGARGPLTALLRRHRYRETLEPTREATVFLQGWQGQQAKKVRKPGQEGRCL